MTSSRQIYNRKLDEDRQYWCQKLFLISETASFPITLSPSPNKEAQGQSYEFAFPSTVFDRMNALTEGSPFLLYVVVVTAIKICLQKYTGADLIGLKSPRRFDVTSQKQQFFLPIIDTIDKDMSVRECLREVRENLLEAYRHQDYAIELVLQELKREDSKFAPPAINFAVSFDEIHQFIEPEDGDIMLRLFKRANRLAGEIRFNLQADSYDLIERFPQNVMTLLEAALENSNARIADLPILSESEYSQLMTFCGTDSAKKNQSTIPALFSSQVLKTPEASALIYGEQRLSYAKLNERANQLAHYLRALGVGAESLVGICLEGSPELIISMLAILKAGGAYIPLDPGNPAARLAHMLQDAGISVLIMRKGLLPASLTLPATVIHIDEESERIEKQPTTNPEVDIKPENLAYCIYTSGSSGSPKAVAITHEAIAARTIAMGDLYGISPSDCLLQFVSPAFDAFGEELYPILIGGGKMILSQQNPATLSPQALLSLVEREKVTILHFVVTYWLHLLKYLADNDRYLPLSVCCTIVGGEPMSTEATAQWQQRSPSGSRLFNAYGPTEATITTTTYEFTSSTPLTDRLKWLPIGKPLPGSFVYIINTQGQLCPIGLPGKLYLGGGCLARGYLHQADLTAEKFIPDSFSGFEGSRMYDTGDLARWLPDGSLEFRGRKDMQIKMRGYRIELGEIEAVLLSHPIVEQCVVNMYEDDRLNKRLVAYVVTKKAATITEVLRIWLQERVPDFMVPSNFVRLDALPLNANGKIDRRALPGPDSNCSEQHFIAPRTLPEKTLAEIWAQVLGLEKVSIHDNFFELGGDSILSIQVTARANQAGLQFAPQDIFKRQTIAELALAAGFQKTSNADQGIVTGSVPLVPIQHWFFERNLIYPDHFNQAALLQATRPLNPTLLEQSVKALLMHHDALRLRFSITDRQWHQNNSGIEKNPIFSVIDFSNLSDADKQAMMESKATEIQASLNLRTGPLMRVALFDCGDSEPNRLLLAIHHLAIDGVSWRILFEDLQTSYEQLEKGLAIALPRKSTSFQQWAEQLQAFAQSSSLLTERAHWLRLQGKNQIFLPVDHRTGANTYASEATAIVELSGQETEKLLRQALKAYQSNVEEILLTAVLRVITNWSGQSSLLVDMESHGREEIFDGMEIGRTVGWFTSLYPVWLKTAGSDLVDLQETVKEHLRQIPNRGLGYGLLRYLHSEPSVKEQIGMCPRAEIVFNYLGQFDHLFSKNPLFQINSESAGATLNPHEQRPYLFEITGYISAGRLQVRWSYSRNLHMRETIERLAKSLLSAIQELIARSEASFNHPLPLDELLQEGLTQEELDVILNEVNVEGVS
jgi:amino acid adenylation domain-containing protein/non-ribosomal peptide synthase protein (TIGR01720 family)